MIRLKSSKLRSTWLRSVRLLSTLLLGSCVACASPRPAARVPVVRAHVRNNELTAKRCDFLGAQTFKNVDALADAKDVAAELGSNLVLAFDDELSTSLDDDTGRPVCMTAFVQVVYVRCESDVRSRVMAQSVVVDDR